MMTIKQLKELIKNLPDETPVVRSGSDHNYVYCYHVGKTTAVKEGRELSEDYTNQGYDLKTDYGKGAKIIDVLLVE
jgi:hypothetical protein